MPKLDAFRGRARATLTATIAATAALAGTLSGCAASATPSAAGSSSQATGGTTPGGVYNLPVITPEGNIDPLTTANANTMELVGLASAGLVIESTNGQLEPQLAVSWTPAATRLSWTIKLRQGLKFSNGAPLTARDVVATFDAILGPASQSPAKSSFTGIVKSVAQGSDSSTVVFTLDTPYADFPYLLTGANTWILPAGFKDAGWINDPVGAGQFILEKYTPGQGVTYKKNPYYWDAAHIGLSGINARFYSDTQSEQLAFQGGETDQLPAYPAAVAALGTSYRQDKAGWSKFDAIVFNVTKAPFTSVSVRQAVAWALSRQAITQTAYSGLAVAGDDYATFPDYGVQPRGVPTREADPARVKQLLGGKTVSFTITTYQGEQALAELIQQQLNATGSFSVKLDVLSEAAYYASTATSPWLTAPVTITDWADRLPSQLYGLIYAAGSSWNASHYASPALDKLAGQYEAATTPAARQALASQIAQIEWTDVPVIVPAFVELDLYLARRVRGSFANGQDFPGGFDFRGITVSGS